MKKKNKILLSLLAASCLAMTAGLAVACGDDKKDTETTPEKTYEKAYFGVMNQTEYEKTDPVEYELKVGAAKKWLFEAYPMTGASFKCAVDFGSGYGDPMTVSETEGTWVPIDVPSGATTAHLKITPAAANTKINAKISEVFAITAAAPITVNYEYPANTTIYANFYVEAAADGTVAFSGTNGKAGATYSDVSFGQDMDNGDVYASSSNGTISTSTNWEVSGDGMYNLVRVTIDDMTKPTSFSATLTYTAGQVSDKPTRNPNATGKVYYAGQTDNESQAIAMDTAIPFTLKKPTNSSATGNQGDTTGDVNDNGADTKGFVIIADNFVSGYAVYMVVTGENYKVIIQGETTPETAVDGVYEFVTGMQGTVAFDVIYIGNETTDQSFSVTFSETSPESQQNDYAFGVGYPVKYTLNTPVEATFDSNSWAASLQINVSGNYKLTITSTADASLANITVKKDVMGSDSEVINGTAGVYTFTVDVTDSYYPESYAITFNGSTETTYTVKLEKVTA